MLEYTTASRHAKHVMQVNKYRSPRAKRKRTVNANKTVVEGIGTYLPDNRQELTPRARSMHTPTAQLPYNAPGRSFMVSLATAAAFLAEVHSCLLTSHHGQVSAAAATFQPQEPGCTCAQQRLR